jgi:ESCRT-I complex subunit TSG101
LLTFFGVIPIQFQGAQYNIPVQLWIPFQYPTQGPTVFVTPTPNMFIKHGRFVDLSGRVLLPVLSFWNHKQDHLLHLCHALQAEFSKEPPVVARIEDSHTPPVPHRSNQQPSPPPIPQRPDRATTPSSSLPRPNLTTYSSPHGQGQSLPRPISGPVPMPYQQIVQPIPSYGIAGNQYVSQQPGPPKIDPQVEELQRLRALLHHRILERTEICKRNDLMQMDRIMAITTHLERNGQFLTNTITNLEHVKVFNNNKIILERNIKVLEEKCNEVHASIVELKRRPDLDIDTDIKPPTALHQQYSLLKRLLETVAELYAWEDCLYHESKSFGTQHSDSETFLKTVRKISRDIFMKKALIKKIQKVML